MQAKYEITRKTQSIRRSTPLHISLTLVLFPDVQSHGRQTNIDPVFTPEKVFAPVKVHQQFFSCVIDLATRTLFPRPKTQWSLKKGVQCRTFLSQPG